MLKNYFKITWRNVSRNKVFSLINISGLSVGLACCMLIFLYAKDEVSYDRFHKRKAEIYRITSINTSLDGTSTKIGVTGMMPGPAFKRTIPEVTDFARLQGDGYAVKKGMEIFDQPVLVVDSNFFSVFSFPLLHGNPVTALKEPYSIVLSEETARKYFGKKNALGQTLELKTDSTFKPFTVTGIAKKVPQNSSIKFEMLLPMAFKQLQHDDKEWINFFLNTFVVIKPGADLKRIEARFAQVFNEEAAGQLKDAAEKFNFKNKIQFGLQPLLDMHLSKDFRAENGLSDASNPMYSYILSGIALFIFLIACINFINLTIARSLKRAKEIGIRKVVGGQRKQLVVQFLGESFILSFIAFVLAILLVLVLLPFFNTLANKALSFSYLLDTKLVAGFAAMFLVTGLLAGFYPALVLSRFNPVDTLYGRQRFAGKNYLSKGLIVLQFTLATFLIIATIVIYSQFSYLINFDLGYNDKNVAVVNTERFNREKLDLVKNELRQHPAIVSVCADQGGRWGTIAHINGGTEAAFDMKVIDEQYFPLLQIPIIKGRNFSKDLATDTAQSVMVNESFVKMAGWKEPLGQVIDFFYNNKKYTVIGVVRDYHFVALNEKIGPQIFLTHPQYELRDVFVKIKEGKSAEVLPFLQTTFKRLFPFQPYQYKFKDVENALQYESEAKWKQIVSFGAGLTLFISCIGLFGLSMLAAEKRTKEIGIRKVLGASVALIVKTLSTDFLKLVLMAALVAIPAAWWIMHQWLQNYPYRIAVSWWMFGFAVLLIFFIALVTISFQAIRAALANPVKSLRTE
jgi:putative ABC transport system permease protein